MLSALLATLFLAQTTGPVTTDLLPFEPSKITASARVELKIVEDGQSVTYIGVPLASILGATVKDPGTMPALRTLSDSILLVRGSDGYQAAVSAAAVAMDPKGERYFLAVSKNGKPLGEGEGPVRLIVPGDPRHVRWVKMVNTIRLVKLDKL